MEYTIAVCDNCVEGHRQRIQDLVGSYLFNEAMQDMQVMTSANESNKLCHPERNHCLSCGLLILDKDEFTLTLKIDCQLIINRKFKKNDNG